MLKVFDFERQEVLTLENIIRATFLNPLRLSYKETQIKRGLSFLKKRYEKPSLQTDQYRHEDGWSNLLDAEEVIEKIQSRAPETLAKFNDQKIKLKDCSRINSLVDADKWLEDLKILRWFGPFPLFEDFVRFKTGTSAGEFYGLILEIRLTSVRS